MEDFEVNDGQYQFEPLSIHPAYPFRMSHVIWPGLDCFFLTTVSGRVTGSSLKSGFTKARLPYSDAGSGMGYGYMWRITGDKILSSLEEGSYFASGYNGHFIFIIPDMDLIVVHRVNTDIDNRVSSLEFFYLVGLILDAKIS